MKKFVKRLFKLLLVSLLLLVAVAVVAVVRSRQQPDWYVQAQSFDPARLESAAREAQHKIEATWNWLSARQAAELRAQAGDTRPPLSPVPSADFSVTFTEQELNAFFQRWQVLQGWDQQYNSYVTEPAIVLRDGKVILAGKVKKLDRVVSFHFRPTLDAKANTLRLDLESVMAGKLPMPQAFFDRYRQQLSDQIAGSLPDFQEEARVRPDGSINDAALQVAMGQLMVAVLSRGTVEPVLLLAGNYVPGGDPRMLPVRLVDVKVDGESVTLAVEVMNAAQREAWLQRLRGPFGKQGIQGQ